MRLVEETVRPPEADFLADASDAEWLARTPGCQEVVVCDLINVDLGYILSLWLTAEAGGVGTSSKGVVLHRPDTSTADCGIFETVAEASDAREDVDKGEPRLQSHAQKTITRLDATHNML